MKPDTQAIAILGRNWLVSELIRAGLEVAFPIRDKGIDLIVYGDRASSAQEFFAIPVQMKSAIKKRFSIDKNCEKIPHLLIAYLWGIEDEKYETFVLTYPEALKIAMDMGFTKTDSWTQNGQYASATPSKRLERMIRKFQMTPEKWQEKLVCDQSTDKHQNLLALGQKRRNTPPPDDYHSIHEYHNGAYESEYVSPYTKSAKNVDAHVAIILQDWSSHDSLSGPFEPAVQHLGYTPTSPTNVNLIQLLKGHFDLSLGDVFATNLFPFIKPGDMTAGIPARHMLLAARDFADPQIRVVRPKLAVCLGVSVFNALRGLHGLRRVGNLTEGIKQPFSDGHTVYWCQAHTGRLGFINREHHGGAGSVGRDWAQMSANFKSAISAQ